MDSVVDPAWLDARLGEDTIVIVDVRWYLGDPERGRGDYEAGHIPGAIFLDLKTDLSAPEGGGRHPLPEPNVVAEMLGRVGIGNEHTVIVYDTGGGGVAARLWWMLRWLGHSNVAILDGGYGAWKREDRPIETGVVERDATEFYAGPPAMPVTDAEGVASRLGQIDLVDARAPERYRGEKEPIDPIAGHIPTAINLPHTDNVDDDGYQRSSEELAAHYAALGSRETVVYCGSGVTACLDVLSMERAGLPTPTLYAGSWSDWLGQDLPVVTGPDPL